MLADHTAAANSGDDPEESGGPIPAGRKTPATKKAAEADANAAGTHLLRHLRKIERDQKTGRPKRRENQPSWSQAAPLEALFLWLDQLARADLAPRDFKVALQLATRCANLPYGDFRASETRAHEMGRVRPGANPRNAASNLRAITKNLTAAGLIASGWHTTHAGEREPLLLFRVALNSRALAEAEANGSIYTGELRGAAEEEDRVPKADTQPVPKADTQAVPEPVPKADTQPVPKADTQLPAKSPCQGLTREKQPTPYETDILVESPAEGPVPTFGTQDKSQEQEQLDSDRSGEVKQLRT